MLLLLAIGVTTGAAAIALLESVSSWRGERAAARARVRAYRHESARRTNERLRHPLRDAVTIRLARLSLRLPPRRSEGDVASRLVAAGLATRLSASGFLALELEVGVGLGLIGGVAALGSGRSVAEALFLTVCLGATGILLPRLLVEARKRRRVERIRADLPDALDLLAVAVSAGLGLDAAIAKLVQTTGGPLSEELGLVLTETRIGESRQQALRRMARRLGTPEVASLVRSLVQGEQLGASLGETLRTQAREARRRRRAVTEERAAKAPVKLLFPTALLIFPALFVVVLAPAVLMLTSRL